MTAAEFPAAPGLVVLDNPECGDGVALDHSYTFEEVAELHLQSIERLPLGDAPTLVGLSMGGMILSAMAARLRARLPARTRFVFVVTTPNLPELPAITPDLERSWATVRKGNVDDFARILSPFFSRTFLAAHPDRAAEYFAHRAHFRNRQSPRALFRQLEAMRQCRAHEHFRALDDRECTFIGAAEDYVLGPLHNAALRALCPRASHVEHAGLGHMVHYERPEVLLDSLSQ